PGTVDPGMTPETPTNSAADPCCAAAYWRRSGSLFSSLASRVPVRCAAATARSPSPPELPMSRAYHFAAGPAALPEPALRQAQAELLEWDGARASIAEISHRSPEFMQVAAEAEADLRRLLSVPDDHAVLFLSGGATTQQALVALNFAAPGQVAD